MVLACNDNNLYHFNLLSKKRSPPIRLNSCPLQLEWQPLSLSKRSPESTLAVGCSDGSIEFFQANSSSSSGQREVVQWPLVRASNRKIQAHDGSITAICWSHDDSSLATCGDGEVKIWSRVGHLRIKLAAFESMVYCASWGPNCESLVIAHGNYLSIAKVHGRSEAISWSWASGTILALDWNMSKDLIVAGDELGIVSISSPEGACLFTSQSYNYPITSVRWFPSGKYFAIGGFGIVNLLDYNGNIHDHVECPESSSVLQLGQRYDASHLIGGTSNEVIMLNLVGQKELWNGTTVELCGTSCLKVETSANASVHTIESKEAIISFKVSFGFLVVLTSSQCQIYNVHDLSSSTPTLTCTTINLKDDATYDLCLGLSYFSIIGWNGVRVYMYNGTYSATLDYQMTSSRKILPSSITIGDKVLGIIDDSNEKTIRIFSCEDGESFESNLGTCTGAITHEVKIKEIFLSQVQNDDEQYILILDAKEDLFITPIQTKHYGQEEIETETYLRYKLGGHIKSAAWDEKSNTICCLQQSKVVLYHSPAAAFMDVDFLKDTKETIDLGDKMKLATVKSLYGSRCAISLLDESILHLPIQEGLSLLHELASSGSWDKCIRICRFRNNPSMWGVLATFIATSLYFHGSDVDALSHELDAMECALMALKAIEKLEHLRFIRKMSLGEVRIGGKLDIRVSLLSFLFFQSSRQICNIDNQRQNAELSLFKRKPKDAVSILLQAQPPLVYDAIKACTRFHHWAQALDIAKEFNDVDVLDIVLWHRAQYLQGLNETEYLPEFKTPFQKRGQLPSDYDFGALKMKVKKKYSALGNRS